MAAIQLRNVAKTFPGGVSAVRDFTLDIADGEFVVLVGPSGCGKSTTLRMVAGLEEISGGTISIGDRVVNDVAPKDRDLAMVFQNYALYPHMTVFENMAFALKLRRFPKAEIATRVREAAKLLGLGDLLDRLPKALSGGQRQRVAVGRAIVRQPAAFLFDEPLSNLDAKLRVQMRVELKQLHQRLRTTMVYVTHDQVEAMTMGDRIVVMKDGVIQQVDAPLGVYDQPANRFVAGFIGTPPMNFLAGRVVRAGEGLAFTSTDGVTLAVPPAMQAALTPLVEHEVTLGLRPEDIASLTAEASGGPRLRAQVEVVEPMGAESYVYLTTGTARLVARLDAHRRLSPGEQVDLPVLMAKAHFFDVQTERTII